MKLTKELLNKIIKEEMEKVIAEQDTVSNEQFNELITMLLADDMESANRAHKDLVSLGYAYEKVPPKMSRDRYTPPQLTLILKKGPFSNYFKTIKYPNHPAHGLADGYEVHEYSRPDYDEYIIKKEDERFSI